jgi:hypothetical protein
MRVKSPFSQSALFGLSGAFMVRLLVDFWFLQIVGLTTKISDSARETRGLQPQGDGRVDCSALLGPLTQKGNAGLPITPAFCTII